VHIFLHLNIKMAKLYILDTSVAGLILDGELWSREPGRVIPYHKDLGAALAHTGPNMSFSDLTRSSSIVKRSLDAWKWAETVNQKDERLVITPTVRAELMEAGQYRDHAWMCWEELGIEELYGSSYYNIDQKVATNVLSNLHSKLTEAVAVRPSLTDIQRKALDRAVRVFSDNGILRRVTNDMCMYIEACIAHKELAGDTVILITDDHKFFTYFALSDVAEGVLVTQVQQLVKEAKPQGVVDSRPPIRIKVAGEIIPGMRNTMGP
jgi:hypothetical protein